MQLFLTQLREIMEECLVIENKNTLETPIFVVGCMRSGTTLISKLLGDHPDIIHCPFELKEIWSRAGNVPMSSPKTQDTACPSLTEKDIQPDQLEALTEAFNKKMQKVCKRKKKNPNGLFLNKNPHLCNKLPLVNALFPNSRFIWIYRDLPKVVASVKLLFNDNSHYWPEKEDHSARCWIFHHDKQPAEYMKGSRFFPGGDAKYLAEYWYENNKAVSQFLQLIDPDRFHIVKEEELTKNPAQVISSCFEFLNVKEYVPVKLIEKIDSNRNSLWSNRLNKEELQSLLNFIERKGDKIDEIFPDNDLYKKYKNEVTSALDTISP
ncbi:sulfotransferase family protein [Peribacillus sp. SCS-155]|uniref:sulfotransferase family protein n=1 Tax=Peribacillus sedimenti TaxID=3115297 RepID=UPI003905D6A4